MRFTVKTRQDGKVVSLQIEAADKAALWQELERRGIKSVIAIADGGAASGASASVSPQVKKGLIAGLLVVGLAAAFLAVFTGGDDAAATEKSAKTRKIKDAETTYTRPAKPEKKASAKSERGEKTKEPKSMWVRVEKLSDGNEKRWTANGECYYVDLKRSQDTSKPVFTNDVECTLALYIHPGEDMPPPPDDDISDADALAACNIPLYAFPDDTDEVLDEREIVHGMKQDLKKYLEEGGHAKDYIRELIERQDQEAEYVRTTREEVEDLIRKDECDTALKFLKQMNERLAEKGIPPLRLGKEYQELLDEVEQDSASSGKGSEK